MEIETIDNFRPTIDLLDLVDDMRGDLQKSGLMQPIPRQKFEIAIAHEIEITRSVSLKHFKNKWDRFFPGVEFSEELLQQKLDETIARWKDEAYLRFEELAKKDANVRVMKTFIFTGKKQFFRRWDVRLLVASAATVFTFPLWFSQIFAPSDWQLSLGTWGLIANLGLLGFLFVQASRNQRKVKENG